MSWQAVLSQIDYQPATTGPEHLLNNRPSNLLYPLAMFSCLAIEGPERFKFLQGQVTCDIKRVEEGEIMLGAHLNLQGRIEASFILFPREDRVLLVLPEDQADHLKSLFQKYILFANAELNDAPDYLPYLIWPQKTPDEDPGFELVQANNVFINVTPTENAEALLTRHDVGRVDEALAIMDRNGLFLVDQSHRAAFLPQELNYEQIDGISFNKGCYKGQEVVARIHFKGQVKQRLTGFHCDTPTESGTVIVDANGKKCGEIVHQCPLEGGSIGCALLKVADWESKSVFLEQNDGPELRLLTPPYAIT